MPDSDSTPRRPIALEQLLQLKRTERPAAAFWDEFDRELRRRQLAALVTVRPWHQRLAHALFGMVRRSAPVGAAAAALAAGVLVWERSAPPDAVLQTADVDTENGAFLLPEERISPLAFDSVQLPTRPASAAETRAPRYVLQQLSATDEPQGAFVVVASPNTLNLSGRDAGVYMLNTLTSDSAPRSARVRPAAGTF